MNSALERRHYAIDTGLVAWLGALPKTETHVHLEGCIALEQLQEADPERYATPPPFWDPDWRFADFAAFQREFDEWIVPFHADVDRYAETARNLFARCAAEGCRYVETSFHLPVLDHLDCSGPELLAAIRGAAPPGLEVRVVGGMMHVDYARHGALLEAALSWDDLYGIDLHGPEELPVDVQFPDYWRRARDAGKVTKAHAGEFQGAGFVRWAVDVLGVRRIEHGTRAIEDPALVEQLAASGVVLDMCPISNVKLAVEGVPEMAAHPLPDLLAAGVVVTVSTDDTFLFGNTLLEEYAALMEVHGLTPVQIGTLVRNGLEVADLDASMRATLCAELDALITAGPGVDQRGY